MTNLVSPLFLLPRLPNEFKELGSFPRCLWHFYIYITGLRNGVRWVRRRGIRKRCVTGKGRQSIFVSQVTSDERERGSNVWSSVFVMIRVSLVRSANSDLAIPLRTPSPRVLPFSTFDFTLFHQHSSGGDNMKADLFWALPLFSVAILFRWSQTLLKLKLSFPSEIKLH